FFPFKLMGRADFLSDNQGLKRSVHGTREYFGRSAADDGLNDTVDGSAIVDVSSDEGCIDRLGGHENRLEVDSLIAVETFVIRHMERQKADVGRLDTHSDFSHRWLRMYISSRDE